MIKEEGLFIKENPELWDRYKLTLDWDVFNVDDMPEIINTPVSLSDAIIMTAFNLMMNKKREQNKHLWHFKLCGFCLYYGEHCWNCNEFYNFHANNPDEAYHIHNSSSENETHHCYGLRCKMKISNYPNRLFNYHIRKLWRLYNECEA